MEDDVAEGQPGLLTRCARCCVKKKNAAQMTGGPGLYTPRLFVCVWCLSVHGVYVSLLNGNERLMTRNSGLKATLTVWLCKNFANREDG